MWSESDGEVHEEGVGRSSAGSEVVMIDERALASATNPYVANLNVTKSSRVQIGPRFISVTQNVHNNEMIKGRILGLELMSPKNRRKFRCSLVVFVCWAFIAAVGLAFYLVQIYLNKTTVRLNIDLPFHKYMWNVAKNTTKNERLWCGAATAALFACIILIICFTLPKEEQPQILDIAPHEWNITREMWLAQPYDYNETMDEFTPLRLVIIQHTVSPECHRFIFCAAELRSLQSYFLNTYEYDIPYSFMIGNDGRVYEGRGWSKVGAHTYGYNRCAIGIGFIGDYREEVPSHASVTELQINRTTMLLEAGVELGYLHPEYQLVGAKDLKNSESPGSHLYRAIQLLPHYDHQASYRGLSCDQIHALYN